MANARTKNVDKSAANDRANSSARVYDNLELLAEMSQDFAASLDMTASLKKAISHITDYMDAEGGALFLLEPDGQHLKCHASVGATEISGLTLPEGQGIVGRSIRNNVSEIVRDVSKDASFHKGVDDKTGFTTKSILCAPMSVNNERIGAIELINKRGGDGLFDVDNLHLLSAMSASAALAIKNARMAEALVEQERIARELELAAEIQRSLLPGVVDGDYPVHGINFPARTVSGDFFDFFELDDGRICFNLGDVSGKGMNAALLMAKTASLYRCLGKTIEQPSRLLARVNVELCETVTRGMFVTMTGGVYDPRTGIVRLANAGHEPPLFRNVKGDYEPFPADAPPLGISPFLNESADFPEREVRLDGGALYIFTDGITEGYVQDGQELGVDGLKGLIDENVGLSTNERLKVVSAGVNRPGQELRDDITLLAIDDADAYKVRNRGQQAHDKSCDDQTDDRIDNNVLETELLSISISSSPDRLKLVRSAIGDTASLSGCSKDVSRDIVIAVDEALQNVIRHGYGGEHDKKIIIKVSSLGRKLVILIQDFALSVNVDNIKPRDLDDLRPGGLGTHFIREVMDEVEFLPPPDEGGNVLRLSRRIE